uniref:Chitin-binding type-2 domain-containing protein n=1 Tax=Anopheles farauti TaxID=69004 RepID=A0A182QNF9_9DIPT
MASNLHLNLCFSFKHYDNMFFYALVLRLVWPTFVLVSELSTSEGSSEGVQRDPYQLASRPGARSALMQEPDGGTVANAVSSVEMDSYQGLVGRPGIDFPVLTHIPRTVFDCKTHGNGYFADLETRCQVFHICDDGKKISFLCPNGTIFRQLDLICDWWFKVDCAATPNHFAESTEMLTQAKRARLQSKHPIPQPVNPGTISVQDKRLLLGTTNHLRQQEFNRRIDRIHSAETGALSDQSNRNDHGRSRKNNVGQLSFVSDEIQDTAQSASFATIAKKMFNTYYAQDQLPKDLISASKQRHTETKGNDGTTALPREARVESNGGGPSNGKSAMSYMPYTTARKLNLSGKVTQFYTPTVPTFTTSTRTVPTVGAKTGDAMVTTKATTISGVGESELFAGQFTQPVRRAGTTDEESVMDHAMEIMQTIKSLNIDETANNGDTAKGIAAQDVAPARASTIAHNGPAASGVFSSIASATLPSKTSFEFLLHPTGSSPNVDRFRRMRLASADGRKSNADVGHRSLLTRTTLNEYDRLFQARNNANDGNRIDDERSHETVSETDLYMDSQMEHDLEGQSSRYPIFGMANSTQIRELAQIFTHALSAYLQDPITFRRILTEIRPKAPDSQTGSSTKLNVAERANIKEDETVASPLVGTTTTPPQPDDGLASYAALRGAENFEVLDFSDVTTTTTNANPTDGDTTVTVTATIPTTTIDNNVEYDKPRSDADGTARKQGKSLSIQFITNSRNELADEVNGELGTPASSNYGTRFVDQVASLDEKAYAPTRVTTTTSASSSINNNNQLDLSVPTVTANSANEPIPAPQSVLKPPIISTQQFATVQRPKPAHPLEDDEQLQRAQSGSILASHNNRPIYERNKYSVVSLHNFKDIAFTGDNPSTTTVFKPSSTANPPAGTVQQETETVPASRTTMSYTVFFDPLTINDELMELEKPKPTAAHAPAIQMPRHYGWNGTLLHPEDHEVAPVRSSSTVVVDDQATRMSDKLREDTNVMQKKANEMFGDLNDAQADKLMTVMKMADKDKSMRRLILLLIRTCDDDATNANEESRKALLEALINIGGVAGSQTGNELQSVVDGGQRDSAHRRGKEIGYNSGANALYDDLASTATVLNMTATTENYSNVRGGSNGDGNSEEGVNQDEGYTSDEWSKGNDFQTTAATTKMYYPSAEAQTSYLPKAVNTQGRWGYGYDEAQSTQYTTTPLPTTLSQTTVDSSSTIFTTTEPTVTTLPPTATVTTDAPEYVSSTTITTTTAADTEYRSIESLESDSSSELKPPFVVSQRLPKDLSSSLGYPAGNSNKHSSAHNSDTRALELLKSLYSLAARWG